MLAKYMICARLYVCVCVCVTANDATTLAAVTAAQTTTISGTM